MTRLADLLEEVRHQTFVVSGILLLGMMTYTVVEGIFEIMQQIAMVLMLLLPGALLKTPLTSAMAPDRKIVVFVADLILAIAAAAAAGYMFFNFEAFYERTTMFFANRVDIAAGVVVGIVLLEGARRYIGLPLVILAIIFILYAMFGEHFPGILETSTFDLNTFTMSVLLGNGGVFGPALSVSATVIYAFLLFGAALEAASAGSYFMRVATAASKKSYGGPAKAAVVASTLFGMISGSAVANVVMTGTITIPMMKRAGFKPHIAASIEAVASSGGQIMPPIMGATAFVIAAYTGTPYGTVALSAAIPAALFYISIFCNVHLIALRDDIRPAETKVEWERADIWGGLAIGASVSVLIYLLVTHFPPMLAGFYSAAAVIVATLPLPAMRITFKKFIAAIVSLTHALAVIAIACGAAGIIMGIILQSGLGAQLSSLLVDIAGGNIYVLALLTAITSIILGMGLPTIVVYILLASLIAPALVEGGISVLAAHLFVFYYGVIALLTPPLAVASYAAAGVAGSDPSRTGFYAAWFALGKYAVPFMFLFSPSLIGDGPIMMILIKVAFAVVALCAMSLAIVGHWRGRIKDVSRAGLLGAASLLGSAPIWLNLAGLALFTLLVLPRYAPGLRLMRKDAQGG